MFTIACALSGIMELAVWIPAQTQSVSIAFAALFGFASGAFVGLSAALPMSVSPPVEVGYRLGLVYLVVSVPALIMAPLGGAILQHAANGWLSVKVFSGVMCLGGSVIIFGARMMYQKKLFKVF
jgi:MFS transporter, MCT family, aspergillic acid transporter